MVTCRHKKRIIIGLGSLVLVIGACILLRYLKIVSDYKDEIKNMTFQDNGAETFKDGDYIGECDVNLIYAKVRVTVANEKITDIEILKHKNERGAQAEIVTNQIIKEQKIDVDTVSGATNSSQVIKKAVENALMKSKV